MNAGDGGAEPFAAAAQPQAWQPLTFRGVAQFSQAGLKRLFIAQLIVAALVAVAVAWFAQKNYGMVIGEALRKMPEGARLQGGRLLGVNETLLSENKFLAIAVTPDESTDIGQSADAQIQLRQNNFCIGSVFRPDWGWEFKYGAKKCDLGRAALEPLWGAWHPVILGGLALTAVIMAGASWLIFAFAYAAPVKTAAWLADRRLSWRGAWKLSSAALMPGALLMVAAVVLYGCQTIDLLGFALFFGGHFVVSWIYIFGAIAYLERAIPLPPKNPFIKFV